MKNLIKKFDEWVGLHIILDDTLHLIGGILIVFLMFLLTSNIFISALTCIVLAFVKEYVIDIYKGSSPSYRDIIATLIGGAFEVFNILWL